MAKASLWICVRSQGILRRFLRIGAARDGAVYTTIGKPTRGVTVYTGKIEMAAGVTSLSQDYTSNPSTDFEATSHHTGFKPSGAIFSKFDGRGYSVMPFPELRKLNCPLLLEQVYPSPLDQFVEVKKVRVRDVVIPDAARSPQNIHPTDIEERFGDQPFHFKLIAVPKGIMFSIPNPATVGFAIELEVPLYRLVGVFRQDDADLQRGWLERPRVIACSLRATTLDPT